MFQNKTFKYKCYFWKDIGNWAPKQSHQLKRYSIWKDAYRATRRLWATVKDFFQD